MHRLNVITTTLKNSEKINVNQLLEDYELDFSLFTDLDERLLGIQSKGESLELPYKIIIILYAELHSLRKVAALLGVSHSTCAKYINLIKDRLLC